MLNYQRVNYKTMDLGAATSSLDLIFVHSRTFRAHSTYKLLIFGLLDSIVYGCLWLLLLLE
jgi:hypothetical protein